MASEIVKYQPIVRAGEIQVGPTTIPIGQIRTSYPKPDTHVVTVITSGGMGFEGADITFDFLLETAERVDQFVTDVLSQTVSLSDCPLAPSNEKSENASEGSDYVVALDGSVRTREESSFEPLCVLTEEKEAEIKDVIPSFISMAKILKKIDRFSEQMNRCLAIYERELNRESPKTAVETEILTNSMYSTQLALEQLSQAEDAVLENFQKEELARLQNAMKQFDPDSFPEE